MSDSFRSWEPGRVGVKSGLATADDCRGQTRCFLQDAPISCAHSRPGYSILVESVQGVGDTLEYLLYLARAMDVVVIALVFVKFLQRGGLAMVYLKALFNGLEIVVGASGDASAFQESVYEFIFRHIEPDDGVDFRASLRQHCVEFAGLGDGAWKTVEDDSSGGLFKMVVELVGEDGYHESVRDELALGDVAVGNFSEFSAAVDVSAQQVAGRDMIKTVMVDEAFALGAFAAPGSSEYYEIHRGIILVLGRRWRIRMTTDGYVWI